MTRATWDDRGNRRYHTGVDRGMLYSGLLGVPWNGLVSVATNSVGGDAQPYYLDGQKVLNIGSGEDFGATIVTYAVPDEFAPCAGRLRLSAGLYATDQPRQPFGFSYRTLIGNDVDGNAFAYKVHIIFNALAKIGDYDNKTIDASSEANTISIDVSTVPVSVPGYRPTAHVAFSTLTNSQDAMNGIEDILYGGAEDPRMPTTDEIAALITL